MSRSAIYTANTSSQALAVGETIALGSVVRRFGSNIHLAGESIRITGGGYYNINASFIVSGTTVGPATITLMKDGVAIPGAIATVNIGASGDVYTVPINAIVREYGCCLDNNANFSFVLSGTAETISNASVVVEKI